MHLARLGWLEHPTYRFEVCRSIHLSYRRVLGNVSLAVLVLQSVHFVQTFEQYSLCLPAG